jgi:hypothetical protein
MIVMLSAFGEQPGFVRVISPPCGPREPRNAARVSPAMRRSLACRHDPRTARHAGRAAHHHICPVDNVAPRVDDLTAGSFFLTHPVDGITAGNEGAVG